MKVFIKHLTCIARCIMQPLNMTSQSLTLLKVFITHLTSFERPLPLLMKPLNMTSYASILSKVILTHLTNFARPLCFHIFPLNISSQTQIYHTYNMYCNTSHATLEYDVLSYNFVQNYSHTPIKFCKTPLPPYVPSEYDLSATNLDEFF